MFGQIQMTPAVKNILIINVLFFAATYVFSNSLGIDLNDYLGLHYYSSGEFGIWQFVSYMFMHAGFYHLFFNMFSVFMFGRQIEMYWGTKRFVAYYMITGIGAAIVQEITYFYQASSIINDIDAYLTNQTDEGFYTYIAPYVNNNFAAFYERLTSSESPEIVSQIMRTNVMRLQDEYLNSLNTIGASGCCFGILLAFGMMFPESTIMLMIPPMPIKAKYFVIIYGVLELIGGVHNFSYDNVAHWAHLGGMIFGFLLIKKWQKEGVL